MEEEITWTGNNLQEVINFTGKHPDFSYWFGSWEEYEKYVKAHDNILKLFTTDGSGDHYEVYVGCTIRRTTSRISPITEGKYKFVKSRRKRIQL